MYCNSLILSVNLFSKYVIICLHKVLRFSIQFSKSKVLIINFAYLREGISECVPERKRETKYIRNKMIEDNKM